MLDLQAYVDNPHGSASWAQTPQDIAPLLQGGGPHLGYYQGHALSYPRDGPIITIGGAGSSKGASVVIPTLLKLKARGKTPVFLTDPAGQSSAVVGADFCFNPSGLHPGILKQHRCNPLAFLKPDSPTLYEDCEAISEAIVEQSGGESKFWDEYAADMARFAAHAVTLINGRTSLPSMWQFIREVSTKDPVSDKLFQDILNQLQKNPKAPPQLLQDAIELFDLKQNNEKAWPALMATLKNAIGMSASPSLSHALSGDDLSLEVLVNRKLWKGKRAPLVAYCIPGEQKHNWRAVTRVFAVAVAVLARRRKDMGVRPYLLIDEAGALGSSPLVTTAVSEDRKFYQSHFVFQAEGQLERHFGPAGAHEIMASAAVRQFLGANEQKTAKTVSGMLGEMTLRREDPVQRDERQHHAQRWIRSVFFDEVPLLETLLRSEHESHQGRQSSREAARLLLTPSEVLTMPNTLQVIFVKGFNPVLAELRPYYEDPNFKGRYKPDPYHPARKSSLLGMLRGAFS